MVTHYDNARRSWTVVISLVCMLMFGCGDDMGPHVPELHSVQEYAWPSDGPVRLYHRSEAGQEFTHELQFSNGSIAEILTCSSTGESSVVTIAYESSSNSARVIGCGPGSVPHIPANIRFDDYTYSVPGPTVAATHWLRDRNDKALVADGNKLLYQYDLHSRQWTPQATPWFSSVSAMARDSSSRLGRVICGTESDGVWARDDGDESWYDLRAPAGQVSGLAVDVTGTIFAVINGTLWQYGRYTTGWETFPITSLTSDVESIATLQIDETRTMLFIGRRALGLVNVLLVSSLPVQMIYPQSSVNESILALHCSATSAYPSVAVCDPPLLHVSTQQMGNWASVLIPAGYRLTTVCQSDHGGVVLIGSETGMLRFDGAPVQPSGLEGQQILSLHHGNDGAFYCGTTEGSYRSSSDGLQWTRVDRSPVLQRSPTGLTLLPATFAVGTHWDAGNIVIDSGRVAVLTGRVLEHFDEFILPENKGRFEDVVVVRYAQETPEGNRVQEEYAWTIYYARGLGPVYIEEYFQGRSQAKTWMESP